MTANHLPLSRFKVLDLTGFRAGPTAARQLADWGADVLKIDVPGGSGDAMGGSRDGPDFQNLHRNKRGITLNLKSPEGREIMLKLVKTADVVIENFRANVKFRLGIDYETLRAINPGIVYGSISGFGQTGPYADRPGVDQIAQGMGGLMSITGQRDGTPTRIGIPIADLCSGIFLAQGILMALLDRDVTGKGQWVQTSLLESQIFMLDFQATRWLMNKEVARPVGNDHPTGSPTGMYATTDGYINISASDKVMWQRLCKAMGLEALVDDPRFFNLEQRLKNRAEVVKIIADVFATKSTGEWLDLFDKGEVSAGPVYSIDQVFADPQVEYLGIAKTVNHPRLGPLKLVGQPIHMSAVEDSTTLKPTPEVGEDSDSVLASLGYSDEAIADLKVRGVL